ncbi:MAG: hypothetical protein IPQ16_02785 [Geobacteraceae bacterium]|nr:hypothetical protein [Geobacteraceae bacterium]
MGYNQAPGNPSTEPHLPFPNREEGGGGGGGGGGGAPPPGGGPARTTEKVG